MRARRTLLAGALGALLAAGALPSAARADVTWEAYNSNAVATVASVRGMNRIIDDVAKATDGKFHIKIHLGGSLQINATSITSAVADNVIQLGDDVFFTGNVPVGGVMRLPMLVRTDEEYAKAAKIIFPFMQKAYEKKGLLLLGSYTFPPQVFWSRKPLASLADVKGQKLRVTSPEQGELIRRFGGSSVTMQPSDVPASLDRGVIDGALTASSGAGYVWRDLLKSNYRLGLNYVNAMIIVNKEAFDALPADYQAALRRAIDQQTPWIQSTMWQEEVELTRKMQEAGMVVTPARPDDVTEAQDKIASYWNEWAQSHGPDAVEALKQLRAALGR